MKYSFDAEQHVHKLDDRLLTGTSTVMSVLAKPLSYWASGMAVGTLGWLNPKKNTPEECLARAQDALGTLKTLEAEEYVKLLNKAYRAHAEKLETSADAGTDLHAELERYVRDVMADNDGQEYPEKIMPFIEWTRENVKKFLWAEMHCFSKVHMLGGISDCGVELKDGAVAIIDFKSGKDAYPASFLQVGGYNLQLAENGGYTKDGQKIFTLERPITQHIIVPFGAPKVWPVARQDVFAHTQGFLAALQLYRTVKSMTPND